MEGVVMDKSFWDGRNVFMTGHTGFKGGWLTLLLKQFGAKVSGYALAPAHEHGIYTAVKADDSVISTIADVRNADSLRNAMVSASPEIVFHLAAQPLVRTSYDKPAETFDVNVMGTVNFLEAVRATPSVRVAVIVTSDKCYENTERLDGYQEDDPMGGSDPYSSSKGCAELVTTAYRRSYFKDGGTAVATVRAGNVIGGGDWSSDRLIPDLIRAFSNRQPLRLRYPHAVRPWQHVLDPLSGYLTLAENMWSEGQFYSGGWNFGPLESDTCSVLDLVCHASELWGEDACWIADASPKPHEAHCLRLDCSRAHTGLDWFPKLSINEAVDWTISWYRTLLAGSEQSIRDLTMKQIEQYESLAFPGSGQLNKARGAC